MRILNLILASLGLLGGLLAAAETKAAKPNIIVIIADDLGYGDTQTFWLASKIPTPAI